jgi:hypothetical protein
MTHTVHGKPATPVLGALLLAALSFALSQTLVAPALPHITTEYDTTATTSTWVLTGYLLSASVCTPLAGKLGDLFGKARVLSGVLLDAFDLADALGVPEPEQPSEDWIFKPYYADCMTLEEYFENSGETDILDMLLGFVDGVRGAMLKEEFAKLDDDITKPSFNFLTIGERAYVDARILELTLKAYEEDGLCRIATYTIKDGLIELTFEAEVNAAGITVALRTPYDERDGLFLGSRGLCH